MTSPRISRISSIDLLRGAVMVLMAIDHVRVYSGVPAGGHDPAVFFTRWITHFCVPAFVFFAGTSAFLYGTRHTKKELTQYLFIRGMLLVLLELTVIRFGWMFNFDFGSFTLAGVIWMLGWCMILLAAFVRLRAQTVGIIGFLIAAGQQVFHYLPQVLPGSFRAPFGQVWEFFYPSGLQGVPGIAILYVLIPWIGVMMLGYAFGMVMLKDAVTRRKFCLVCGWLAIGLFLVIAGIQTAMQTAPPNALPFVLRMLSQQKYPASQLYLLMTLGPLLVLLPLAERARGWIAGVLETFGRVPFFYYLLHIPLIHVLALFTNYIREGAFHQDWYNTAPFTEIPGDHRWSLGLLYLVFIIAELILYLACRSYAKYKFLHPEKKWLRYI